MRVVRLVGGSLVALVGIGLVGLALGILVASLASGNQAWVLSPFLLPPVPLFLAMARAIWRGKPVRDVAGLWTAVAALGYSGLVAGATVWIARGVAQSPSALAGTAFIIVLPLWPLVVLLVLVARGLLHRPRRAAARALFFATSLCWFLAWVGFWVYMMPTTGAPSHAVPGGRPLPPPPDWLQLLTSREAWVAHAFFLLPSFLAAAAGWSLPRSR